MASAHETITRASVDDCVCTFVGTISSINRTANTATVTGNGTTYNNVPLHFHCEGETDTSNGHRAFKENDDAICLKTSDSDIRVVAHNGEYRRSCNPACIFIELREFEDEQYGVVTHRIAIDPQTGDRPWWWDETWETASYAVFAAEMEALYPGYSIASAPNLDITYIWDNAAQDPDDGSYDFDQGVIDWNNYFNIYNDIDATPYPSNPYNFSIASGSSNCPGTNTYNASAERITSTGVIKSYASTTSHCRHVISPGVIGKSTIKRHFDSGIQSADLSINGESGCLRFESMGSDYIEAIKNIYSMGYSREDITMITPFGATPASSGDLTFTLYHKEENSASYPSDTTGFYRMNSFSAVKRQAIISNYCSAFLVIVSFMPFDLSDVNDIDGYEKRFFGSVNFFKNGDGLSSSILSGQERNETFESVMREFVNTFEKAIGRVIRSEETYYSTKRNDKIAMKTIQVPG